MTIPLGLVSTGIAATAAKSDHNHTDIDSPVGGVWALIADKSVTNATHLTFSSIPSTYRHLLLEFDGSSSLSSTASAATIEFNGDTGNHYEFGSWETGGGGNLEVHSTGAGAPGDFNFHIGDGSASFADTAGGHFYIYRYAASLLRVTWTAQMWGRVNNSTYNKFAGGLYNPGSTTNITQIDLVGLLGGVVTNMAYMNASLYGIP